MMERVPVRVASRRPWFYQGVMQGPRAVMKQAASLTGVPTTRVVMKRVVKRATRMELRATMIELRANSSRTNWKAAQAGSPTMQAALLTRKTISRRGASLRKTTYLVQCGH